MTMQETRELPQLQQDFLNFLLHAETNIQSSIISDGKLSNSQRLEIYAQSYRLRLKEALLTDFPVLANQMGDDFTTLVDAYIQAYPSQYFSIRWVGLHLSQFLNSTDPYRLNAGYAELAEFEWKLGEAFDAANTPLITEQHLRTIATEDWPNLHFSLGATLRLVKLSHDITRVWEAFKLNHVIEPLTPLEQPVTWLIWRQSLKTYFRALEADEAFALSAVMNGCDFSELCAGLTEWHAEQDAAYRAASLLKRWIQDELIAEVIVND